MKSATVAEAANYPLVMPKTGHTRDGLENLFHERKLKPRYRHGTRFQRTAEALCSRRHGSGIYRAIQCAGGCSRKCVSHFPMADAKIRRDLALVFRKDKALSRAALAFIDIAVKIKTVDTALAER